MAYLLSRSLGTPAHGLELIASMFVLLRWSSASRIETQQLARKILEKEIYSSAVGTISDGVSMNSSKLETPVKEEPSMEKKSDHPISLLEKPIVRDNHPPQNTKELHLMLTLDFLAGKGSSLRPYDVDELFRVTLFSTKLRIFSQQLKFLHHDVDFPLGVEVDPTKHRIQFNPYGLHLQDGMLFEDKSPKLVLDVAVTDQKDLPPVQVRGKELRHVNPIVDAMTKVEFNTFVDATKL